VILVLLLLLLLLLHVQAVRDYISSYSPLHNLSPSQTADYPALLLTASLHDTRVNFW
jgi:protease II